MNHCDSLIHILGYNLLFTGMYGLAVEGPTIRKMIKYAPSICWCLAPP